MTLLLAVLAASTLVGCTSGPSSRTVGPRAPSDTELGECQREAYNDPKVKALVLQNFSLVSDPIHDQQLRVARLNATNACLRARGLTVPGGVEPVIHGGYLF